MMPALTDSYLGSPVFAWISVLNVVLNLVTLLLGVVLAYYCHQYMRNAHDLLDVTKRYVELTEDIATATGHKIDTVRDDIVQTVESALSRESHP